jgi:hypothetical protein
MLDGHAAGVVNPAEQEGRVFGLEVLVHRLPGSAPMTVVIDDQYTSSSKPREQMYQFVAS